MKQRLTSYVSSPVGHDEIHIPSPISFLSPKLQLSQPNKDYNNTRVQSKHLKTRSVVNSRENSLDTSNSSKMPTTKRRKPLQNLNVSTGNYSFQKESKNFNEQPKQKVFELFRIIREFALKSVQTVELLAVPSLSRHDMHMALKNHKTSHRTFEENLEILEKGLLSETSNCQISNDQPDQNGVSFSKLGDNALENRFTALLEENKNKEKELKKLTSAIEILKNEKALMQSECKKLNHLSETQRTAKEEARNELIEAQKNTVMIHQAFNSKISTLQNLVANAFKGIELFEAEAQRGLKKSMSNDCLYRKMKEMEYNLSEALNQGLNSKEAQHEIPEEPRKSSPRKNEAALFGEKELYETKRKLLKMEKLLDEKDRKYEELYAKYEYLKLIQRQIQEDNNAHVNVIEKNLDIIMDKLEDQERTLTLCDEGPVGKTQVNFEELEKENESSLREVDSALKKCLDITRKAKKKIVEITSSGSEVKRWLEKENEMLREGLSATLDKVKELNKASGTLKEILEESFIQVGDAVLTLESKIMEFRRKSKLNKGADLQGEKMVLEETLESVAGQLRELLRVGMSRKEEINEHTVKRK